MEVHRRVNDAVEGFIIGFIGGVAISGIYLLCLGAIIYILDGGEFLRYFEVSEFVIEVVPVVGRAGLVLGALASAFFFLFGHHLEEVEESGGGEE